MLKHINSLYLLACHLYSIKISLRYQLEAIEKKFVEITKSIDFLSSKYDQLLDMYATKLLASYQAVKNRNEDGKQFLNIICSYEPEMHDSVSNPPF